MNDYIDRQAAIDAIEKLILPQTKGETMAEEINRVAWRCAINCAEEMIGHLPGIEPVKHGRWEFETAWQYKPCDGRGLERKAIFGTTKRTFNRLKCSGCKKVVVVDDTIHYAYCPHCGAKMEGE